MLEIHIIASGSSGNCYLIEDNGQKIIIDPGIKYSRIQGAADFGLATYDFCLISHEHNDHCESAGNIARLGIDLLTSAGTFKMLGINYAEFTRLESEEEVEFKGWRILPFSTQHDAMEPLGFLILTPSGSKILFATDTYYIRYSFKGVTHYMVECNYSKTLLADNQNISKAVKDRIISSHFELENVKKFFREQDIMDTKKIYLLHLSEQNSDKKYFIEEIQKITGIPVYAS